MPDLLTRDKYEDELAAALLLAWDDPIRVALDGREPNWGRMEKAIDKETAESLKAASTAAALLMVLGLSGANRLPPEFKADTGQSRSLGRGLTATRRDEWGNALSPEEFVDRWLSPQAAKGIAATEVTAAVSAGEAIVRAEFGAMGIPMIAVWNIDPRSNVCPVCLGLAGLDEDHWRHKFPNGPPAHPRCLLGETPITVASLVSVMSTKYHGPVVRIECADGSEFRVTPNHMLLTPQGFVQARCLNSGDDMLRSSPFEVSLASPSLRCPDDKYKPPRVDEIVRALSVSRGMISSSVPVSPEYLHGDAVFADGNIDVVRANSVLRRDSLSEFLQPLLKLDFENAAVGRPFLDGLGHLASVLNVLRLSTDGGVSGLREVKAFLASESRHSNCISFRSPPDFNATILQAAKESAATDSERLGNAEKAFAPLVSRLKVRNINVEHVDTLVYDVETDESMYTIGNGVISSNCRCYLTYRPA